MVQDGFNVDLDQRALNQNFKILDWRDVENQFARDTDSRDE